MSADISEHKRLIQMPFEVSPEIEKHVQDRIHCAITMGIVRHYGTWMKALVTGQIAPATKSQVAFIDAVKSGMAPQLCESEKWEQYARAWIQYLHAISRFEQEKAQQALVAEASEAGRQQRLQKLAKSCDPALASPESMFEVRYGEVGVKKYKAFYNR